MDIKAESLAMHYKVKGKLEIKSRVDVKTSKDLSLAYTPGVAEPCLEIQKDYEKSFLLTRRNNLVAVVTDGSAVLGLGNIGPEAGMPVMEGKCVLFKEFADIDAFPLCIRTNDIDEIVRTVYLISGSFGGINLEDIAAPRCFEIEKRLKEICDIPVFHDDQHGTAIIVAAGVINALKLAGKTPEKIKCVINGAGAAGTAICEQLMRIGIKNVVMCDKFGALSKTDNSLSEAHKLIAEKTNPKNETGTLSDVIKNADLFVGVSAPNVVSEDMIRSMADKPIVFAMANPVPEIMPEVAKKAGAFIVGTGRSDYPNQINNVLAFPGVFKGALSVRAKDINDDMKLAASYALAGILTDEELSVDNIIPKAFDKRVVPAVSKAVAEAATKSGVAQI